LDPARRRKRTQISAHVTTCSRARAFGCRQTS
jgi:hypothetical protein